VYAARSEVIFDLRDLGWDAAERFLATQAVVARSRPVLAPVADTFGVPVSRLERELSIETLSNSEVIRLEYASRDQAQALEMTKALTELYLSTSRELAPSPGNAGPRVLTPAFVLEKPVSPRPVRAAALGAGAGVAFAVAALVARPRRPF
jgi:capsular polysaccharide biosynthesis protein